MQTLTAGATGASQRRWYGHGLNRPWSWRLILSVTPRLPRFVLWPLSHFVAGLCFLYMYRERGAVRRNLARVTGLTGFANLRLAYRLFHNFSRFLTAYAEMKSFDPKAEPGRLSGVAEVESALRDAGAEGRGVLILTMHMGHWDLGLRLLAGHGRRVHVVMLSEDPAEVTRFADEARAMPEVVVHQVGESSLLAVTLLAALRSGDFVAVQGDRAAGSSLVRLPFFGADADLPAGAVQLAMASGAPIVPVFVVFDGPRGYRLVVQPPLRFERARRGQEAGDLRAAMEQVRDRMEQAASRWPDQWFNFYDLWEREPELPWRTRLWNLLVHRHTEPWRLAAAVALGVFVALTPFYGFHTLLIALLCWPLRLNITAGLLASQIANPLVAPALIAASAWLGTHLGAAAPAGAGPGETWWNPRHPLFWNAWLRGGLALGAALGLLCGFITWAVAAHLRRRNADA